MQILFLLAIQVLFADFSETLKYELCPCDQDQCEFFWETEGLRPFDELILSWNGLRPEKGKWSFWVGLRQKGTWSPWLPYAEWSSSSQKTFKNSPENSFAACYQDAAFSKSGLCDAFRVLVKAEEGADLSQLQSLFACLSSLANFALTPLPSLRCVFLTEVPRQSQIALNHPRAKDLCSPTSTATAINYLLGRPKVDAAIFANQIRDETFDIYGNWVLNTAQAYLELEEKYACHVERLNDFSQIHAYLSESLPVVVSVKGPLPGSATPYSSGHLICIIGYDPEKEEVFCIDPAFAGNEKTFTRYPLQDFLNAWALRKNIAYVFPKE